MSQWATGRSRIGGHATSRSPRSDVPRSEAIGPSTTALAAHGSTGTAEGPTPRPPDAPVLGARVPLLDPRRGSPVGDSHAAPPEANETKAFGPGDPPPQASSQRT